MSNYNNLTHLQQLALDVMNGNVEQRSNGKFSNLSAQDKLRDIFIKANGNEVKFSYRKFQKHKHEFFEAIEEVMPILIHEGIQQQFDQFVEYKNVEFGEKNVFMAEDYHLYQVSKVGAGNSNVTRQRLDRKSFDIETDWREVKISEEWERFLGGKIDWAYMVNKVTQSIITQMGADAYAAITAGYQALTAPYSVTGTYDRSKFNGLAEQVEASTLQPVTVFGTKLALQNMAPQYVPYAGETIENRNKIGYFEIVDGYPTFRIRQAVTPGTDNLAIADNFLLVVPQGEKQIVKMVMEGQPIIEDVTTAGTNGDDSVEFLYKTKWGCSVVTSTKYGAYVLS